MKLLAKFENEAGTVSVHKGDGFAFIVMNSDLRRTDDKYQSKTFSEWTEAVKEFWEIREQLMVAEVDMMLDCQLITTACSLREDEVCNIHLSFDEINGDDTRKATMVENAINIAIRKEKDSDPGYYNHAKNLKGY